MKQYLEFLEDILKRGELSNNRTAVPTISCFANQFRVDLSDGFPLVTTKKLHLKSVIHELLWFISGDTNIKYLIDNGVRIWNEWPFEKYKNSADYQNEDMEQFILKLKNDEAFCQKYGNLGPVYGYQWRHFESHGKVKDQLLSVIEEIKVNPRSRRLIISAWNPALVDDMALPPCHMMMQFHVSNDNKLSLQLYQRSADAFLGVPFNIASYALLLMMVANVCDLEVGEFIHTFGDCHIYTNHLEQVKLQLSRTPYKLPKMTIKKRDLITDFVYDDFILEDYQAHPHIKGDVAV